MLIPVPDITAISVVKAIDRWITTFGPPKSILSDNGPQFISSIYRDFMKNHQNVKFRYTSTYHPQCNGQIERLHRWIKGRLCCIARDGGLNFAEGNDDWSDYLGVIQYTYNSTPNRMTTYSAMDIVLGKGNYKWDEFVFNSDNPKEYIDFMANRQAIINNNANTQQLIYDTIREKSYNKKKHKHKPKEYEIGQKVLWNINSQFVGNPKKLGEKWIGPYEIVEIFNNYQNYRLRIIPLSPLNPNPTTNHKLPRRASTLNRNNHEIQEFNVPRDQIKPYSPSYEDRFDETNPDQILIQSLNNTINNNPKHPSNVQHYKSLFHLYHTQTQMGYSLK